MHVHSGQLSPAWAGMSPTMLCVQQCTVLCKMLYHAVHFIVTLQLVALKPEKNCVC